MPLRGRRRGASHRASTGFDCHSRDGDSSLINPAAGDWRPKRSALAWEMGVGSLTVPQVAGAHRQRGFSGHRPARRAGAAGKVLRLGIPYGSRERRRTCGGNLDSLADRRRVGVPRAVRRGVPEGRQVLLRDPSVEGLSAAAGRDSMGTGDLLDVQGPRWRRTVWCYVGFGWTGTCGTASFGPPRWRQMKASMCRSPLGGPALIAPQIRGPLVTHRQLVRDLTGTRGRGRIGLGPFGQRDFGELSRAAGFGGKLVLS